MKLNFNTLRTILILHNEIFNFPRAEMLKNELMLPIWFIL